MALDRDNDEQTHDDNCADHINYHNTNYSTKCHRPLGKAPKKEMFCPKPPNFDVGHPKPIPSTPRV